MPDKATWEFINSFAPWLAAVGTLAAVVTSLYLARRGDRLRLSVKASVIALVEQGGGGLTGQEFVQISVTNVGRRTAKITSIHWRSGPPFARRHYFQTAPQNALSGTIPHRLEDGEQVDYLFYLDDSRENLRRFGIEGVLRRWPRLAARLVRVGATTSAGRRFWKKVHKSVRDEIVTASKGSA